MWVRRASRALLAVGAVLVGLVITGVADAGPSDLQQISPLVWTMIAISIGGTLLTFGLLFYAVWKFRDPETKDLPYG